MKKFVVSLMACLALVPSMYAATSALIESILEYDAIIDGIGTNPEFEGIIPGNEFIIDIQRFKPREVDTKGKVKYKIVTRVPTSDGFGATHANEIAGVDQKDAETFKQLGDVESKFSCGCKSSCGSNSCFSESSSHSRTTHIYLATVLVEPNPAIGPNIVTLLNIRRVR